jgi:hypothetical protein
MIAGVDWGFWGVVAAVVIGIATIVVAIATLIVTIVAPVVLDRLGNTTRIAVSGIFDQTGVVLVRISKTGRPPVHIEDVTLLRPGQNQVLPLVWRSSAGSFDIAGGKAEHRCYFQLPKEEVPSNNDAIDVYVRRAEEIHRERALWTELNINLPAGLALTYVRGPGPGQQAGPTGTGGNGQNG